MRPIPAPRIGDAHGLLRAIEQRGRLRTDEFVTEFTLEQLFPPELENALSRMRHFISYARSAGLVKEDRGVVELTPVGGRYVRAGDDGAPFDVSPQQAEWLRRQLREKHMTDSIFHGMAIGLSLLASTPPGSRVSTLDFGRSLAYLGRAGWDNENTFKIQGERYLTLLTDVELIGGEHRLTQTGEQVRGELTLPVHMSLLDIAAQLNPGGAEAVRADADAEWAAPPAAAPPAEEEAGYQDVGPGAWSPAPAPAASNGEGKLPTPSPEAEPGPPVPPSDIWETSGPEESTKAIPSAHPPIVPRASDPPQPAAPTGMTPGDPLAPDSPTVITPGTTSPVEPGPPAPAGGSVAGYETVVGGATPAAGDTMPPAAPGESVAPGAPENAAAPDVGVTPAAPGSGGAYSDAAAGAPGSGGAHGDGGAGAAVPDDVPAPGAPGTAAAAPPSGDVAPAGVPGGGVAPGGGPAVPGGGVAPGGGPAVPGGGVAPGGGPAVPGGGVAPGGGPAVPGGGVASVAPGGGVAPAVPGGGSAPRPPGVGDVAARAGEALGGAAAGAAAAEPAIAAAAVPPADLRGDAGAFVDPTAIRAAAESAGLRLPVAVYANVSAALAAGKHVILTGAPGAGKTSLALAIARAAAQVGRAHGATIVTARQRWDDQALLVDSAKRGRWVIVDELDRARLDRALGELSSFLAGLPVLLPSGEEAVPDAGWRIVATAARAPRASAALLRRFAIVEVPPPAGQVLVEALNAAAGGDATAAAAIARLLPLAEVAPLGAGVFIDAARHAAARHAAAPADEATLAREAYAAYIAPLLGDVEEDAARRIREIVGDG